MPVLYTFRYVNDITGLKLNGRLSPLLIPTSAADADENLPGSVMDMPVVAASRLECYIVHRKGRGFSRVEILRGERREETFSGEKLSKTRVRLTLGQSPAQASAAESHWLRPFSLRKRHNSSIC